MKLFKTCLTAVVFVMLGTGALFAEEAKHYDTVIGYSYDGIQISKSADARLAFELWVKEIASKEHLEMGVNYYNAPEEAFNGFMAHDFDLITFNPFFYLREHKRLQKVIQGYWAMQVTDSPYEKYLIIVRRDSGITSPAELKNRRVATRENNYMGRLFLDRLLLESAHRGYDGYIKGMEATEQYSTAVLRTYFKNVEAAIVPEYAYGLVREMNPALQKELTVIAESPKIFPFVIIAAHAKMPMEMLQIYERNAYGLEKSERGRMILDLYKLKRVVRIPPSDLETLQKYYDEYIALKARYGGGHE